MNKYSFCLIVVYLCFIILPLTACSSNTGNNSVKGNVSLADTGLNNNTTSESIKITLTGNSAQCGSDAVLISGSTVTIKEEGTYLLSGTLQDGMIIIDAGKKDEIHLIFDGISVSNSSNASIYAKSADKLLITLNADTVNTLENRGSYTVMDDTNIDSVIFSKCDLIINGEGSLFITADEGHGIVTKDNLNVTDGTFTITAEVDGINAGKNIQIDGGSFTIHAGDDGVHGDESVTVNNGSIEIVTCNEGIEGNNVAVCGGFIKINSDDDGINASGNIDTGSSLSFSGGTIYINASGDGVDSNGSLSVSGGALYISGPSNNSNSALDYETSAQITGGIVVAAGSSGMAANFGNTSTQGAILLTTSRLTAGTEITVKDSDGNELITYTPENDFNSVVVSCPEMVQGGTYIISTGNSEQSITLDNLIYGSGMDMGSHNGPGDMHGPGSHDRGIQDNSMPDGAFPGKPADGFLPMPDGEIPDMPDQQKRQR